MIRAVGIIGHGQVLHQRHLGHGQLDVGHVPLIALGEEGHVAQFIESPAEFVRHACQSSVNVHPRQGFVQSSFRWWHLPRGCARRLARH